jgi:hypothetical protein
MFQSKTSERDWLQMIHSFGIKQVGGCVLVIVLMPLNWAFESAKWKLLLNKIHKTSFVDSYKSVLLGATLGNLSPFMIGDFVGRLRDVPSGLKAKAGIALLLGNGMQMFVLILFGKVGYEIMFYGNNLAETTANMIIRHTLTALIIIGFLFFSKRIELPKFNATNFLNVLNDYSKSTIFTLFNWAFIRHLLFTIQFVVLLEVFEVNLPVYLLVGLVSIIFLFKILGAVLGMFGDIVSRQLTAAYFFGLYAVPIEPVLAAVTLLWIINIFVPMFVGTFLVFSRNKVKFNKV